jgi:hypothetical protein
MSLINDLIPEVKELLLTDEKKYPYLIKKIFTELETATFPPDLTVGTAQTLIGYFDLLALKADHDSFIIKLYAVFGK